MIGFSGGRENNFPCLKRQAEKNKAILRIQIVFFRFVHDALPAVPFGEGVPQHAIDFAAFQVRFVNDDTDRDAIFVL